MSRKTRALQVLLVILLVLGQAWAVSAQQPSPGRAFFPLITHQRPHPTLRPFPKSVPYVVQPGDTLFTLARRFHRPLHQLACAIPPDRPAAAPLVPGETLFVPPERSVCHVVAAGQTLAMLARAYGVTVTDVVAMPQNGFQSPPYEVVPGQRLLIPIARGVRAQPWTFGDGRFRWPVFGVITQRWSPSHPALDIAADEGTPVAAADTGVVAWAGWDTTGYGWLVIVDHRNGYRTYYAHLHSIWVARGERVIKGQPIGTVGSTGHSTGPHLHFEIRDYGVRVDPASLLPARPLPPARAFLRSRR